MDDETEDEILQRMDDALDEMTFAEDHFYNNDDHDARAYAEERYLKAKQTYTQLSQHQFRMEQREKMQNEIYDLQRHLREEMRYLSIAEGESGTPEQLRLFVDIQSRLRGQIHTMEQRIGTLKEYCNSYDPPTVTFGPLLHPAREADDPDYPFAEFPEDH